MRGSEEDSFNSFDSSSEDLDQNRSFQEVLTRKKAKERREIEYKWTVLQKITPHKKVMEDYSGWWNINDMTVQNQIYNYENFIDDDAKLYVTNKNDECYKTIINPINKQVNIALDKPDPIKIYNINKQIIFIKVEGKKIGKNTLHYCHKKTGAKEICYEYNDKNCIEIEMKDFEDFYKEQIEIRKRNKKKYVCNGPLL